jgi:poly-beta-hydroxyalkanoate depolymerase
VVFAGIQRARRQRQQRVTGSGDITAIRTKQQLTVDFFFLSFYLCTFAPQALTHLLPHSGPGVLRRSSATKPEVIQKMMLLTVDGDVSDCIEVAVEGLHTEAASVASLR